MHAVHADNAARGKLKFVCLPFVERDDPLVFVDVAGGSLTLEGVDVAVKWPDAVAEGSTLLQVKDGDLTATDCTFSLTGQPTSVSGSLCRPQRGGNPNRSLILSVPGVGEGAAGIPAAPWRALRRTSGRRGRSAPIGR